MVEHRPEEASFLNIVAHQDDDLLFMNPDLDQSICSGAANTTVYLTAGEAYFRSAESDPRPLTTRLACKRGGEDELDAAAPGVLTREQYVDCRRRGILAAYAAMLRTDDTGEADDQQVLWRAWTLDVTGGRLAECFTSLINPAVSLVFLNLPENADSDVDGGPQALRRLWTVAGAAVRTVRAVASVLGRRTFRYDRDALVAALVSLMDLTVPSVVRCLDGQPDSRYQRNWEYHDHTDHVVAGRFAAHALEIYSSSAKTHPVLVAYRGYNTAEVPANLHSGSVLTRKTTAFWTYAAYDNEVFAANHHEYRSWLRRMYHRWPIGTTWVAGNAHDCLHAFAVVGHEVRVWWQTVEGRWRTQGLGSPPGQSLVPGVSVCRTADNDMSAFVLGYDSRSAHTVCSPQVFAVRFTGPGGKRQPMWTRLGSPYPDGPLPLQIGQPVASIDGEGRVHVCVRTPDGGLSSRRQTCVGADDYSDWEFLGGSGIHHEPALVTDREGSLEVFATTASGSILHWKQDPGNPTPSPRPSIPSSIACSGPTAVLHGDGRVALFHRADGQKGVESWVREGSVWGPGPVYSCPDGTGALAAIALPSRHRETLLLGRGIRGRVDPLPLLGADVGRARARANSSPAALGEPAVAMGRHGRIIVLVLGTDSWPYAAEQTHPPSDLRVGPWQPLPI
jgi:LmbE family N-acetylglucosaminyl deacetylase